VRQKGFIQFPQQQPAEELGRGAQAVEGGVHVSLRTLTTVSLKDCWPEIKSGAIGST
jgi:hypothetical protein